MGIASWFLAKVTELEIASVCIRAQAGERRVWLDNSEYQSSHLSILKHFSSFLFFYSRNAKSGLETAIEHLVGKEDQPRGTQVHAM